MKMIFGVAEGLSGAHQFQRRKGEDAEGRNPERPVHDIFHLQSLQRLNALPP